MVLEWGLLCNIFQFEGICRLCACVLSSTDLRQQIKKWTRTESVIVFLFIQQGKGGEWKSALQSPVGEARREDDRLYCETTALWLSHCIPNIYTQPKLRSEITEIASEADMTSPAWNQRLAVCIQEAFFPFYFTRKPWEDIGAIKRASSWATLHSAAWGARERESVLDSTTI